MIRRLIILLLIVGCGPTMQNLTPASEVQPNMAKKEVLKIMGEPIISEFSKNVEEWHYCKTDMNGISGDRFVVFFFADGKVITKQYYLVTMKDTKGVTGSCERFIKMGDYRVPDEVKEIRVKFN